MEHHDTPLVRAHLTIRAGALAKALSADGIDLIHEDDAGLVLPCVAAQKQWVVRVNTVGEAMQRRMGLGAAGVLPGSLQVCETRAPLLAEHAQGASKWPSPGCLPPACAVKLPAGCGPLHPPSGGISSTPPEHLADDAGRLANVLVHHTRGHYLRTSQAVCRQTKEAQGGGRQRALWNRMPAPRLLRPCIAQPGWLALRKLASMLEAMALASSVLPVPAHHSSPTEVKSGEAKPPGRIRGEAAFLQHAAHPDPGMEQQSKCRQHAGRTDLPHPHKRSRSGNRTWRSVQEHACRRLDAYACKQLWVHQRQLHSLTQLTA